MSTVTLNNAKGAGDFLRLRFWGTVLLMLGALLAFSAGSAFAAPLAGTAIGNQASASYKDFNNVDRITVSNSVSTLVTAVGVATLTQSQTKLAAPGQTIDFPHTIVNNGNAPDTFAVTIGAVVTANAFVTAPTIYPDGNCDGVADSNSVVSSVGPLAPGGQGCFVVRVTAGTTSAASGSWAVNFNSGVAGATLTGNPNTDTITISANAVINVSKSISISTGPSGTIATYQLTYRNTGTVSSGNVVIADKLPSGATYVAGSGRWSVTTGTALTDAQTDTQGTSPNSIDYGFNGAITGGPLVTDGSVVAIIERVDPGVQGIVEFQVTMNGTVPTVNNQAKWCYSDVGTGGTIIAGGGAEVTSCTNIRGTFGAGALVGSDILTVTGAGNTNQSNVVPFYIPSVGVNGNIRITDNAANTDGTNPATTAASTLIVNPSATNGDDVTHATAGQGTLATWDAYVLNNGGSTDTINITVTSSTGAAPNFPAGTSFLLFRNDNATPLTDSNSDGTVDTGPLAPGIQYRIRVVAVLPPSAGQGNYDAIVQAQSTNVNSGVAGTYTNTVALRAAVVGSRVDLTNYNLGGGGQSAAGGAAITTVTANPGTVATFGLIVTNTGSVHDTYDLAYNVGNGAYNAASPYAFTTPGTLPTGYAVAFHLDNGATCAVADRGAQVSNTGVIAPAALKRVCVLVTVPNGAPVATTQFFFRALSPTTFSGDFLLSSGDVKRDDLTINSFRSVAIAPNNSGQGFPGGSVQYCHTVTNAGNTSESALVITQSNQSLNGTSGWGQFATFYRDTDNNCVLSAAEAGTPVTVSANVAALAAGASANYIVVVQVPGAAAAGQTNVSTFTLSGAPTITNAVVTDTTVVVIGQVSLVKDQVLDTTGSACSTAFVAATLDALTGFTQAQLSAAPNTCIIYRVRATNVGTQTVTAVTINDTAPPNSTRHATAVSGATNACTPGAPAAPDVNCTIATLSGGATTTMYFRVRINP